MQDMIGMAFAFGVGLFASLVAVAAAVFVIVALSILVWGAIDGFFYRRQLQRLKARRAGQNADAKEKLRIWQQKHGQPASPVVTTKQKVGAHRG